MMTQVPKHQDSEVRYAPTKVDSIESIPFHAEDVLFIEAADKPDREVLGRIQRYEFKQEALCFIGDAPDWAIELTRAGHRVFELPAGTALQIGQRALKPHPSSRGVRWLEIRAGQTSIKLN